VKKRSFSPAPAILAGNRVFESNQFIQYCSMSQSKILYAGNLPYFMGNRGETME